MKHFMAPIALLISGAAFAEPKVPQVRPEDMPEFISIGAVATFDNFCLATYSDRQKFAEWQQQIESQRQPADAPYLVEKLKGPNEFQQQPTDETYRIKTPLVSFVMNVEQENSCTIFALGGSRDIIYEQLETMLRGYIENERGGNGGKLKIVDNEYKGMYSKHFAILSPTDVPHIEVVFSDSIATNGAHQSAITGVTRRRVAK